METKKNFNCIDEQVFADVCGTIKAQATKQADKQQAYAVADTKVIGLDNALKGYKNCIAVAIRAVEQHAAKRSCVSDIRMLELLREQVSEVAGKQFRSISILSKEDVIAAVSSYLCNAEPCILCDTIFTVNDIYSNGFIVSAE